MTMVGRAEMSKLERKSASRVAFPAIWKPIIVVEARVAAMTADGS